MDFKELESKTPESLTDEERLRLGLSFYDASRREDQRIAQNLGVTAGDAMKIAIDRVRNGQSIFEHETSSEQSTVSEE